MKDAVVKDWITSDYYWLRRMILLDSAQELAQNAGQEGIMPKQRSHRTKWPHYMRPSKKVPEATRALDIGDLKWAAGFIEGEGCFQANNHGGHGKASGSVVVTQVNREPIKKLQGIFGGSIYFRRLSLKNKRWSDFYEWHATGPRARGIMMTLFSMMSQYRKQQIMKSLR